MRKLPLLILLTSLFWFTVSSKAQVPESKTEIDQFIDSIGKSRDRNSISSSLYPAVTDGTNPKWRLIIWFNSKNDLLWVEDQNSDSTDIVYFYCHENLIFVDQITDSKQPNTSYQSKKLYFFKEKLIFASNPDDLSTDAKYYIRKSKDYLELFKSK